MSIHRIAKFAGLALLGAAFASQPVSAQQELVYGNWTPPREYQNVHVMPEMFKKIEQETNGAIKWKLVAGGALADGKGTFSAVKDNLMQGGLGIVTYAPNVAPSTYAIYATVILGHDDVVAATGAAMEVFYQRCPSCLEEFKKQNMVVLGGWTSSAYLLACTTPIKSPADFKGKRVRATGGNAELMRAVGGVAVAATLVEAVSLLQRGGIDCQHGIADWLRTFGYGDFVKYVTDYPLGVTGPALGMVLNRDAWNKFTPDQKKIHVKYAAWMSAKQAIGNFILANEESLRSIVKEKGVQIVKTNPKDWEAVIGDFAKVDRERNIATAKGFGVADPAAIIDDYTRTVEKWRPLSKQVGRDIDKYTELLMREIYSKIDIDKL